MPTVSKEQPGTKPKTFKRPPVKTTPTMKRRPWAIVLYSPPGVGKTTLAGLIPNVGFVIDPKEMGIQDLKEYGIVPQDIPVEIVDRWKGSSGGLLTLMASLTTKYPEVTTWAFDALTGMEALCFQHHCNENYNGDWSKQGFYSYFQGPKSAAKTDWPEFLDACDGLRHSGKNIMLLAHSHTKNQPNPSGSDYMAHIPYLDGDIWARTHGWAQAVFFMNFHMEVHKDGLKSKVKFGSQPQRRLFPNWTPAALAKNRYNLPDEPIDLGQSPAEGFANLARVFPAIAGG